MAAREELLEIFRGLFVGANRAPQVYDFDDLPQYGIYDEDAEEAELLTYNRYKMSMPVTVEAIDFFQSTGASADPDARNLLRAQKATTLLRTVVSAVLGSSALANHASLTRIQYASGEPVYFGEESNYVGVSATFVVVYDEDFS